MSVAPGAQFFLNRDARIIRHHLAQAGQRVEERGFAGIGIPDQSKETFGSHENY